MTNAMTNVMTKVMACILVMLPLSCSAGISSGGRISGDSYPVESYQSSSSRPSSRSSPSSSSSSSPPSRYYDYDSKYAMTRQQTNGATASTGASIVMLPANSFVSYGVAALIVYYMIDATLMKVDNVGSIVTRLFTRVSNTYSNVQVLLYLNNREKEIFLKTLSQITSRDVGNNDKDEVLVSMIEDITVAILRCKHSIIAGSMITAIKGSSRRDFNRIDDMYRTSVIKEQTKYDEEVNLTASSSSLPTEVDKIPPSYVIVTFLLSATGPRFRSDRDVWTIVNDRHKVTRRAKRSIQLDNIDQFLSTLPSHLRRINRLKRRSALSSSGGDYHSKGQPYGFNIDVLWSPNRYDESIEKIDIETSYPFLKFL